MPRPSSGTRPSARMLGFALFCATLMLVLPTFTARAEISVPDNATANSFNSGWRCDSGFQEDDGACVQVTMPANAYLNDRAYGGGWACSLRCSNRITCGSSWPFMRRGPCRKGR